jgi:hypothetical protein
MTAKRQSACVPTQATGFRITEQQEHDPRLAIWDADSCLNSEQKFRRTCLPLCSDDEACEMCGSQQLDLPVYFLYVYTVQYSI